MVLVNNVSPGPSHETGSRGPLAAHSGSTPAFSFFIPPLPVFEGKSGISPLSYMAHHRLGF